MYLCPFHFPKQSLHSALFQTKLLHFQPVLPHGVIYAFVLNSLFFADRWSHTIPEAQLFIKIVGLDFWFKMLRFRSSHRVSAADLGFRSQPRIPQPFS